MRRDRRFVFRFLVVGLGIVVGLGLASREEWSGVAFCDMELLFSRAGEIFGYNEKLVKRQRHYRRKVQKIESKIESLRARLTEETLSLKRREKMRGRLEKLRVEMGESLIRGRVELELYQGRLRRDLIREVEHYVTREVRIRRLRLVLDSGVIYYGVGGEDLTVLVLERMLKDVKR